MMEIHRDSQSGATLNCSLNPRASAPKRNSRILSMLTKNGTNITSDPSAGHRANTRKPGKKEAHGFQHA